MQYYIAKNGQAEGPYEVSQLAQMGIVPDTLVWNESMTQWTKAGDVPELAAKIFGGAQPASDVPNGGYQPCGPNYAPNNAPYGAQQQPQPQFYSCPKTWLAESILVTLFCCLPFGIVGIVKSSGVRSAYDRGDYQGALDASRDAGKWTKIGFFCGLAGILLYLLFWVVLGVSMFGAAAAGY